VSDNRAIYELMWQCLTDPDRPQMALTHAHFTLDT